jgi:hypothetical protein
MAALAKAFEFRQDRLLRHLLFVGVSAHCLSLCADGSREAIDQLVSDLLWAGNCGGCDFWVLLRVKGPDFLY